MNLNTLNPQQYEAVTSSDKSLLLLAGAGSGKTRVITLRIAYLIREHQVPPSHIVGLTFTNKAAAEMKERVQQITGTHLPGLFLGTFHSYALRKLRRYIHLLGFNRHFVVYDETDVRGLLRRICREDFPGKKVSPAQTASRISLCKNSMISIRKAFEQYPGEIFPRIYHEYTQTMKQMNALDFDDLLIRFNEILVRFPEVRQEIQAHLSHILVDEFQDTNDLQLFLLKKLFHPQSSICVVGDDDQSIYAWRGAQVRHILEFQRYFKDTRTIRLEQNYRSTSTILQAAHGIISKNRLRTPKKLWTAKGRGKGITVFPACDEEDEVQFVTGEINALINSDNISPDRIAVLYRSNNQSRHFEAALRKKRVPYRVLGGKELFDRAEVKDILTYLKVFLNPHDDNSLLRVINVPQRFIGKKTVEKLRHTASQQKKSVFQVICQLESLFEDDFSPAIISSLGRFQKLIEKYRKLFTASPPSSEVFSSFLNELGYYEYLTKMYGKKDNNAEVEKRYENILALRKLYEDFLKSQVSPRLSDFITSLAIDNLLDKKKEKKDPGQPAVTLLTIHSAKGLEFDIVFLVGFEEGLLPHKNALEKQSIAEERRLSYVAFTRAGKKLYLTYAKSRKRYGKNRKTEVSSFFSDIPDECMQSLQEENDEEPLSLTEAWKKLESRLSK